MTTRSPATVTWAGANARRLARQRLHPEAAATASPFTEPGDAVAAMLGAHAQVLSAAELSVGLRGDGLTRTDVRTALWTDRTLVKTFGPRGTVHLLPAADLPLWTGALSAVPTGPNPFPKNARMTPDQVEAVVAAVGEALTGAELTIDELSDEVVARTGPWAGDLVMPGFQAMWPRWRQVLHRAGHRGALAYAPNRGRKAAYTNPGCTPLPGAGALRALVERYLYAYGPATPAHAARWLAAPKRWAAEQFAALAASGAIEEVTFGEDGPAWVVAGDTDFPDAPVRGVRLLPYFDAFAIASGPRERLFPGAARERALGGGQAGNFPVLLVDGVVAGVWHQRRSGRRIAVTVEPLKPLSGARLRDLEEQVERVAAIMEGTAELTVGPVAVGPHA
ncbi:MULTISPECIES: winged helix DNA-binding domain-containing protein [Streptomyces]|uniref:winged helix DNA-binding domain-containing protein n=1 Tax=Streptomyces TaxID=1883 RepID=UPI0004C9400D|nr:MULTISPECIES: winged helix DNA-binding domain-containing protein [Streptomyces]MDX2918781.1 winged helix DNA-binding domain-containing protein [Streptomyces sp. NE06-03C]MDX3607895.1 winged helix DNA-binding domain-containing protein [Streptomyces sp. FL06-04B]MDX3734790.1 winged helix DNA-binding domain-containing protein [Streptomyces sp. ID01-15D]